MSAINGNWERWIYASIFKFIKAQLLAIDPAYHIFIEGSLDRETNQHVYYFEMRVDGPYYRLWQGFTRVEVEFNVEISVNTTRKIYDQNKLAGHVAQVMNNSIPVYKLGNLAGDDPSVSIGCLRVDSASGVIAHKYGQVGATTRLLQGTVETKYWIDL